MRDPRPSRKCVGSMVQVHGSSRLSPEVSAYRLAGRTADDGCTVFVIGVGVLPVVPVEPAVLVLLS